MARTSISTVLPRATVKLIFRSLITARLAGQPLHEAHSHELMREAIGPAARPDLPRTGSRKHALRPRCPEGLRMTEK